MEKYKIKKDSVMETLLIPLYGKMKATELYPDLFHDRKCVELFKKIDYEFKEPGKFKANLGAIMAGTRQYDLVQASKEYIQRYPEATVVNLGCGLDTSFSMINNHKVKGYNVDFPDVIDIRNELLKTEENEYNLKSDLMDFSWMDKIQFSKDKGIVFFASGVFYYFKKEDVKLFIKTLSEKFPGGKIIFDATNAKGLQKMLKTWLKPSEMKNIGVYFSLEDEKEIYSWSDSINKVIKKPYMTGYRDLDKRYGAITNMIFRYVDNHNLSQIIEIEF